MSAPLTSRKWDVAAVAVVILALITAAFTAPPRFAQARMLAERADAAGVLLSRVQSNEAERLLARAQVLDSTATPNAPAPARVSDVVRAVHAAAQAMEVNLSALRPGPTDDDEWTLHIEFEGRYVDVGFFLALLESEPVSAAVPVLPARDRSAVALDARPTPSARNRRASRRPALGAMTNDWNERKGLLVVLAVTALAVWGYTLTTFARATASTRAPSVAAAPTAAARLDAHFEDPGRDPFEPPVYLDPELVGLVPGSSSGSDPAWGGAANGWSGAPAGQGGWTEDPGPMPNADEWMGAAGDESDWGNSEFAYSEFPVAHTPPTSRLVGVVGRSAMLQTADGQSLTVRVGDDVDGLTVTEVTRDAVTLTDEDHSYVLTL